MDDIRRKEIDAIAPYIHGNVIDVGCGTNKVFSGAIGVDKYGYDEKIPGYNDWISIANYKCDIHELPFKDETVDTVIAFHSIEHLEDQPRALKEWMRVLKPGGHLCLIVPDVRFTVGLDPDHKREWTPEEFKETMSFVTPIQFDTLKNNWSFDFVCRK